MKYAIQFLLMLCPLALASFLAACTMGGIPAGAPRAHLTPVQCSDLTALRNHAPLTRERNASELAALEEAGYQPSPFYDPYYPEDLQEAQRLVDYWYQTECRPARSAG